MQCRKRKEIGCGKSAFSKTKVKEEREKGIGGEWAMPTQRESDHHMGSVS